MDTAVLFWELTVVAIMVIFIAIGIHGNNKKNGK